MNNRRVPGVALAILLFLLPTCSRGYGQDRGTPIIVGDGSIYIRPVGAPFYSRSWVTKDPKEYRTVDSRLRFGTVYLVGTLKHGDWSNPVKIGKPIADFAGAGGQVIFTIPNPKLDETITLADERSNRGLAVRSVMGLRDSYLATDKLGTELKSKSETWMIEQILIRPEKGAPRTLDAAYLEKTCRSKYVGGCGIWVDIISVAALRGKAPGEASRTSPRSR